MEQNTVIDISDADSQDDDKPSEEPAKENSWRRADAQELLAESSNSHRKATAKPTYRKLKSEEENEADQSKSKALEKIKVHPSSESTFFQKLKKWSRIKLLILAISTAKTMTNFQRNQQGVIHFTRKIRREGPIPWNSCQCPRVLIVGTRRVWRPSPLTGK